MNFQFKKISPSNSGDKKKPLTVEFVVGDRFDRPLFIEVAGRHLRTFEAFRATVVDELGVWLDSSPYARRAVDRREDWEYVVSLAFDAGGKGGDHDAN